MRVAAFSIPADHRAERWVVAHRVGWLDHPFVWLTRAGSFGLLWLVLALALSVLLRRPAILVLVAVADLAADLLADLLKVIVDRPRPHVSQLVAVPHSGSFPSGHSATSFACATVLAALVPRAAVPAYLLAAAVAFSRLYVGVHFPLDVLAGAALGVGSGLLVLMSTSRWRSIRIASRPTRPRT